MNKSKKPEELCFCGVPCRVQKYKETVYMKCGTNVDFKNSRDAVPWSRGCGLSLKADEYDTCMAAIANQPRFQMIGLDSVPMSEDEYPNCETHKIKLKLGCSKDGRPLMSCGVAPPNHGCGCFYWLNDSKTSPFLGERSKDYQWVVQHYPNLEKVLTDFIEEELFDTGKMKLKRKTFKKSKLGEKRPADDDELAVIEDDDDEEDELLTALRVDRKADEEQDRVKQALSDTPPQERLGFYRKVNNPNEKKSRAFGARQAVGNFVMPH